MVMFRAIIVDDHAFFRTSLREVLASRFPDSVIEEAADGRIALEKIEDDPPDLVFMDKGQEDPTEKEQSSEPLLGKEKVAMRWMPEKSQTHPGSWGPESELLEQVSKGAEGAFDELERRYRPKILQQLRQLTRDDEDVKDILQDVLTALFLKISTFQGRSSLSTWIYRITVNAYLMHERKQKRKRLFFIDDTLQDLVVESSDSQIETDSSPLSNIHRTELRSKINQALADLPSGYRQVFLSLKGEELSLKEVSRQMGISVPAVKSRQHRARVFLKARLSSDDAMVN